MTTITNPLQRLVSNRMAELDLSLREVSAKSNGRLSHEAVRLVAQGLHTGLLRDRAVEGFTVALQIPRQAILDAMGEPWVWDDKYRQLGPEERAQVTALADELLAKRTAETN